MSRHRYHAFQEAIGKLVDCAAGWETAFDASQAGTGDISVFDAVAEAKTFLEKIAAIAQVRKSISLWWCAMRSPQLIRSILQVYPTIEDMYETMFLALSSCEKSKAALASCVDEMTSQDNVTPSTTESAVEDLAQRKEKLESDLMNLTSDFETKKSNCEMLQGQVEVLSSQKEQLEQDLEVMRRNLAAREDQPCAADIDLLNLRTRMESLQTNISQEETRLADLMAETKVEMAEKDQLAEVIAALRDEIDRLANQKEVLSEEVVAMERQIEALAAAKSEAAATMPSAPSDDEEKVEEQYLTKAQRTERNQLEEKLKAMQQSIDEKCKERDSIYSAFLRAQEVAGSHKELRTQKDELQKRVSELEDILSEQQSPRRSENNQIVETLTAKLETLTAELETVRDQRAADHTTWTRRQTELEAALERDKTAEMEILTTELTAVRDQHLTDRTSWAHRQTELEEMLEQLRAETTHWTNESNDQHSIITALQAEKEELARAGTRMRRTAEQAAESAAYERGRYRAVSAECAKHLGRIQDLECALAQSTDDIVSLEATISALHGDGGAGAYVARGATTSAAEIARSINTGSVDIGGFALLNWDERQGRWAVANSPEERISPEDEAQLALDQTKMHLVQVLLRDDCGVLIVDKVR